MSLPILDSPVSDVFTVDSEKLPSRGRRLFAGLLDSMVAIALIYLVFFLFEIFFYSSPLAGFVIVALSVGYKVVPETIWGYTLGKKIMGLRIVNYSNELTSISWRQANLRFLPWWPFYGILLLLSIDHLVNGNLSTWYLEHEMINWVCFVVALGSFIIGLFHPEQRTWYDRLSNTICIKDLNVENEIDGVTR